MKLSTFFNLALATVLFISFAACGGGGSVDRPAPILTPEQVQQAAQQQTAPVVPSGGAVASGVKHYTCPNNCAGSGGDGEGTCPVCGSAYVHNQAFHNQAITQGTQPAAQPAATPEPPQNAAGVWHYTCSNGCAGGAGSAVACATCGSTLAHNTGYHN